MAPIRGKCLLFFTVAILLCLTRCDQQQLMPDATQLIYATKIENGTSVYHIKEEALDLISSFMKNETFEVISTIGQARKGKSYTLSRLVQTMSISAPNIVPFKSSDFNEPCTHGIWMYMLLKCPLSSSSGNESISPSYPCSRDNKSYLILDIQGTYTETDEEAMRYAAIVTMISSQTFLFMHQKLFKYDIDLVRHIQTIIMLLNKENIEFNMDDLNLAALVREPLRNLDEKKSVTDTVNGDFSRYQHYFEGFEKFKYVQEIPHFQEEAAYEQAMESLYQNISTIKESRMKWSNNGDTLRKLLTGIVDQLNQNEEVNKICVMCVFQNIVRWLPFSEWRAQTKIYNWDTSNCPNNSACSKKCDGGIKERKRECNTGYSSDCMKYIGGESVEQKECNTFKCKWLPYGNWSECSKACAGGMQTRERNCSTGNVQECIRMFGGSNVEERTCNEQECQWIVENEGDCNVVCGPGQYTETRRCESGNNTDCTGSPIVFRTCYNWKTQHCAAYAIAFVAVLVVFWFLIKLYRT